MLSFHTNLKNIRVKMFLVLIAILLPGSYALKELEVLYESTQISFAWPNETAKEDAINTGVYIPEENVPLGISVWKDRIFFTIPRFRNGVAASLAYIDLKSTKKNKSSNLIPYPGWNNHDLENFNSQSIVSSFRSYVDECNRLWLVDIGFSGVLLDTDSQTIYEPASIKIIDLNTDKIVHKHYLNPSDQTPLSFLAAIVVDVSSNDCNNAFAYISDPNGYGLIVYSMAQDDTWRFTHNFFYFEPLLGNLWVDGFNYQYNDGIFGLALGPKKENGKRTLYFHSFISYNEFSVETATLRNKSLATNTDYYSFKFLGFKGINTTSLVSEYDEKTNAIFMLQPGRYGLACWNIHKKLNPHNFQLVAQNFKTIIFPCDLKIDAKRDLYVLAQKFPIYQFSTLPKNKINFRVLRASVDDLIQNTVCE